MQIRRRYPRIAPKLDITPMADLVFQVLLFFMLTSPFMLQAGLRIKLPKTVTAKAELGDKLILTITKEASDRPEKFFVEGREIKFNDLEDELRLMLMTRRERVLILRADKDVPHGIVVEVLDKAKLAGADKLAIATEIVKSAQVEKREERQKESAEGAKKKTRRTQR